MSSNYSTYSFQGVIPRQNQSLRRIRSAEIAINRETDNFIVVKMLATLALSAAVCWGSVNSLTHLDNRAMSIGHILPEKIDNDVKTDVLGQAMSNLTKAFTTAPVEAAEIDKVLQPDTRANKPIDNLMNAFAPKTNIDEMTNNETAKISKVEINLEQNNANITDAKPQEVPVEVRIVTMSMQEMEAEKLEKEAEIAYSKAEEEAKAYIFRRESSNKLSAVNEYGCIGLGQDCSCYKKGDSCVHDLAQQCPNWRTDRDCQEEFWENYMTYRYGSWQVAKDHWNSRKPIDGIDKGHWW